jgi:DNA repair protein RecO (recombination protein O)
VRGSKTRVLLQPGNGLYATWRARLPEQLGSYAVELASVRAGSLMESRESLAGLNAFTAVTMAALPEHQPHAPLYDAAVILLDAMAMEDFTHWGPLYVRWESGLLEALGFGLDLSRCAATGRTSDLVYVSPRTGRAVSAEAGAPYAERLFLLPQFLLGKGEVRGLEDTRAGLRLTGYFLLERVFLPHGREMPQARHWLDRLADSQLK